MTECCQIADAAAGAAAPESTAAFSSCMRATMATTAASLFAWPPLMPLAFRAAFFSAI